MAAYTTKYIVLKSITGLSPVRLKSFLMERYRGGSRSWNAWFNPCSNAHEKMLKPFDDVECMAYFYFVFIKKSKIFEWSFPESTRMIDHVKAQSIRQLSFLL